MFMAENSVNTNNSKVKIISIVLCGLLLAAGLVVGFLMPYRPVISYIEQRDLTRFPEFTFASLMDGTYFANISLWYADSYPVRDNMIMCDRAIKDKYGIEVKEKMIGTDIAFDEIPDINSVPAVTDSVSEDYIALDDELLVAQYDEMDSALRNELSQKHSEAILADEEERRKAEAKIPTATQMEAEIMQYIQQNLLVKDGAAYSRYYFVLNSATKYINALEGAAQTLDGECKVYNILVPNQSGVMLSYEDMLAFGGSNQIEAIHYYYSQYSKVKTVNTIDTLREHNDEYLYFRTDHHWTATAAYYVYQNYCKIKGWTAHDLSYFEEKTFEPFYGSFYSQLQDQTMRANPDSVKAYVPHGTNQLTYWDVNGIKHDWYVISDVGKNAYAGYCCFVGGDKPLAIIDNPEIEDGTSCLVIKESYGNCFIPFLVDHYDKVYIMDCRYTNHNIIDFVRENEVDDLIFINNITIIGSTGLCNRIAKLLEENAGDLAPENTVTEENADNTATVDNSEDTVISEEYVGE